MPIPVIFADAPIGVQFPPSVAPDNKPKYKTVGSILSAAAIPPIIGIIVATYGILSINAEITTEPQTITVYKRNTFS